MPPSKPVPAERKLWHSAWDEERGSRYYWRRGAGRKIEYQLGAALLGGHLFFDAQRDAPPPPPPRCTEAAAALKPLSADRVLTELVQEMEARAEATTTASAVSTASASSVAVAPAATRMQPPLPAPPPTSPPKPRHWAVSDPEVIAMAERGREAMNAFKELQRCVVLASLRQRTHPSRLGPGY